MLVLSGCGLSTQSGDFDSKNEGLQQNVSAPGVVLVMLPNGKGICSGNIVGMKTVLTAAHCVKGMSGRFEIRGDKGRFSTYSYVLPSWSTADVNDESDIALLMFDSEITEEQNILPIGNRVDAGERFKMVGFGCQFIDTKTGSGVRRALTTRLFAANEFLEVREKYALAASTQVRGVTAGGTCFGDSGGAGIVFRNGEEVLVGNVHAGGPTTDGGVKYEISYFTDLTRPENRNWLKQMDSTYGLGMTFL